MHRVFSLPDVCHVLREHHKQGEFIGPRFLLYSAALEMHPLETEDRTRPFRRSMESVTATSRSAARAFAQRESRSPTTRSFPSRNAWWTVCTDRALAGPPRVTTHAMRRLVSSSSPFPAATPEDGHGQAMTSFVGRVRHDRGNDVRCRIGTKPRGHAVPELLPLCRHRYREGSDAVVSAQTYGSVCHLGRRAAYPRLGRKCADATDRGPSLRPITPIFRPNTGGYASRGLDQCAQWRRRRPPSSSRRFGMPAPNWHAVFVAIGDEPPVLLGAANDRAGDPRGLATAAWLKFCVIPSSP